MAHDFQIHSSVFYQLETSLLFPKRSVDQLGIRSAFFLAFRKVSEIRNIWNKVVELSFTGLPLLFPFLSPFHNIYKELKKPLHRVS